MKVKPDDITNWLYAVPRPLYALAFIVLAFRIPETALTLGGLAALAARWKGNQERIDM